jgi:predicted Zn-dependent protease
MKIKFRFYVVKGLKYWAVTAQDGSTFISSNVFLRLHNQAQLAGVIAAGIADVNQDHLYRMTGYRDWSNALCWGSLGMSWMPFVGLPLSAANAVVSNSASHYLGELNRQSGRIAVEYVMNAGYDGREALSAFMILSKNDKSGPKHPGLERTYFQNAATGASNELAQTYGGTDFSRLKTEAEAFDGLADRAQKGPAMN